MRHLALALILASMVAAGCSDEPSSGITTSTADGGIDPRCVAAVGRGAAVVQRQADGRCVITSCPLPWATCGGDSVECDRRLDTATDCGDCGRRCQAGERCVDTTADAGVLSSRYQCR